MKCKFCNKEFSNKGFFAHQRTCEKIYNYKNEIVNLYVNKFVGIKTLAEKYKLGHDTIRNILKGYVRTSSEAGKLAHKLYPDSFKLSEKTKQKIREKRLEFMKNHPEKTAWRKKNISYPEKLFINYLKNNNWHKKYRIEREKSFFPYFADFSFINEKVVVEVDGSQHLLEKRKKSDERKDKLINSLGWKVIRITASEIMYNIDKSFEKIEHELKCRESGNIQIGEHGIYKSEQKFYCKCGNEKSRGAKQCMKCYQKNVNRQIKTKEFKRKVKRPPYKQLLKEIEETSYVAVGKKYGVSDNAIRKWIKFYQKHP